MRHCGGVGDGDRRSRSSDGGFGFYAGRADAGRISILPGPLLTTARGVKPSVLVIAVDEASGACIDAIVAEEGQAAAAVEAMMSVLTRRSRGTTHPDGGHLYRSES